MLIMSFSFYIQIPKDIPLTATTRRFLTFCANTNTSPVMFQEILKMVNKKTINILSAGIKDWIKGQIPQKAMEEIQSLFENGVDVKKTTEEKKLEEKFKSENFDLITWFVVSD